MVDFNLLKAAWMPVLRRSGKMDWVAPWQLTDLLDPPLELAAPRADFNGALAQFWIGLLQTAFAPRNAEEWAERFESPPSPEALRSAFDTYREAFNLLGAGPLFMQDRDELADSVGVGIGSLLIESPGGNTLKNNADHFIKRGGVSGMCPACAATALFTLQVNAPSGGVGHRTGLRGGGPVTTLVVADTASPQGFEPTLWHDLWLNVLPEDAHLTGNPRKQEIGDIFPWLEMTRTSGKIDGQVTTPEDVHPYQMYWTMPRRIRLDPPGETPGRCDICGEESEPLISGYRTKNYGINYEGGWRHPLSPYYTDKSARPLPVHAQPGGISYRHWLGLAERDDSNLPALVVEACKDGQRLAYGEQLRLWAFGYDMDNMKARCWYEATIPLYVVSPEAREAFVASVEAMLTGAVGVARFLRSRVRDAWFDAGAEVRGDLSFVSEMFYERTESAFYRLLGSAARGGETGAALREQWLSEMRTAATTIFDEKVPSNAFAYGDPERVARACRYLRQYLRGKSLRKDLNLTDVKEAA